MSANREKAERYVADPKFDDTRPRWAEVREAHLAGQESRQGEIEALRRELRMKEIDCDELERLNRAGYRHCRDCCCARSWEALGGRSVEPGKDIPACILDLKAEIAALREEIASHAAWAKGFAADPANGAIMAAQAEIAALREAVRRTYHLQSDGSITTTYSVGCFEEPAELSGIENEVRRALEEKP